MLKSIQEHNNSNKVMRRPFMLNLQSKSTFLLAKSFAYMYTTAKYLYVQ
jgi:hypothetical protein